MSDALAQMLDHQIASAPLPATAQTAVASVAGNTAQYDPVEPDRFVWYCQLYAEAIAACTEKAELASLLAVWCQFQPAVVTALHEVNVHIRRDSADKSTRQSNTCRLVLAFAELFPEPNERFWHWVHPTRRVRLADIDPNLLRAFAQAPMVIEQGQVGFDLDQVASIARQLDQSSHQAAG